MNQQAGLTELERAARRCTAILDAGVEGLPAATRAALHARRRAALARFSAAPRRPGGWWGWWAAGFASVLLLALFMLPPPAPQPADATDLDLLLLTGELPPQIFADFALVPPEAAGATCSADS